MLLENTPRRGARERLARILLGDDIFISYSRADGAAYAAKLASELTRQGLSCRFDQWGSKPGAKVPEELLRGLKRSGLFVLVATGMAGGSLQVEEELQSFLRTQRNIIPIDLDGTIRSARWWPLIEGLAISKPDPLPDVLDRVRHTLNFTRRNARLTRLAVAVLVIFVVLSLLSVVAGKSAGDALARASDSAAEAARESARAVAATDARQQAEADRTMATAEAGRARGVADEQQRLAAKAVADRRLAEREAERQQALTAEATANRQLAERERDGQQLAGRAQLAFDSDQNPLMALAYGVAALDRSATVEAGDTLARALSFSRTPVGGVRIGRYATSVKFTVSGRYVLVSGLTDLPVNHRRVTVLAADTLKEVLSIEREKITASAVSADERYLAVADGGACVQIFDLSNGRTITCVSQAAVHDIRFSRDGRYMSLVGLISEAGPAATEVVRLWSTNDWTPGRDATVEARVRGVTFSSDNRHLAVGMNVGAQEAICYWDFESAEICQAVSHPPDVTQGFNLDGDFKDVAFTADGKAWRAASMTGAVSVDLTSGVATRFASLNASPIVDPSGTAFVTRPSGGIATLWAKGEVVGHLVHPGDVRDVRFSPDGQTIVTTCDDGLVRIWDAGLKPEQQNDFFRSNRLVGIVTHGPAGEQALQNRAELVGGIDISPDGLLLATAGNDGWVRTWRLKPHPAVEVGRHGQWVSGVAPGPTPDTFLSSGDYYGRLWRLNPMRESARLRRHENDAHGVMMSADGRLVATTGEDSQVYLFDGRTGRFLRAIKNDDEESTIQSAMAGNANYLLTSGRGSVKLWNTATGALVTETQSSSGLAALAMSPTESLAAIAVARRTLLLDVHDQLKVVAEIDSADNVSVLRFDRTGDRLVVGLASGEARLLDVAGRRDLRVLRHLGRVTSADFSRDNAFLATGSHDRTVRIWDTSRGTEVTRLTHNYRVDAVAFIADDALVAAGGQNYVQVSPWRSTDLAKFACASLNGLGGDSWPRLVGREIGPDICAER